MPLQASDSHPFGFFKGLHEPFLNAPQAQLSPVRGLDKIVIKGMRRHGHSGVTDLGFARPTGRCVDPVYYPQDAMASILERLVPSHIGFVINKSNADKIHTWLKPRCISLMFNAIYLDHILLSSEEDAIKRIAAAMQPEFTESFQKQQENRMKHHKIQPKPIKYSADSLHFASLLLQAWKDNWGEKAAQNGYPEHVVEYTLLVFMMDKVAKKSDLKQFFEALSDKLLDKNKANQICWDGVSSCYSRQDYENLSLLSESYTLEQSLLKKFGDHAFKEYYPPVLEYGMSYLIIDGQSKGVSNCGEILLLTWMMYFNAKPNSHFDPLRLEELKTKGFRISERFIHFFRSVCPTYAFAYNQDVWNAWSELTSDLNTSGENERVQYMHPTPENGTYGIGAGIDNLLILLGRLIHPPKWDDELYNNIDRAAHRLDLFCEAFSPSFLHSSLGDFWSWKVIRKSNGALLNDRDIGNPKDVSILLLLGNKPVIELHCTPKHFEAIDASASGLCLNPQDNRQPHIPESITFSQFPTYFYACEMESIHGKLAALKRAAWHQKRFNSHAFDYIFERWIDGEGKFFAAYEDEYTNHKLIEVLYEQAGWSVDRILSLRVPKLTAMLLTFLAKISDLDQIEHILKDDLEQYRKEGSNMGSNWQERVRALSYLIPNADAETFERLFSLLPLFDNYLFVVSGCDLLHMVCWRGTAEGVRQLIRISNEINNQDMTGNTPLHYAVQNHTDIVDVLMENKAKLSICNQDGELALHRVIRYNMPIQQLLTIAGQMDNDLLNSITNQCKTVLGLALERMLDNPSEGPEFVEYLVARKAFLEPTFWRSHLLSEHQLYGRLGKELYACLYRDMDE
ncbi:MAG: ankyrin repeat domain-containing protein [Alphaproteobacteria bacterium]|nr:ankyrin repeat domain-containing protein [Alphaproteobacteria bacterium]